MLLLRVTCIPAFHLCMHGLVRHHRVIGNEYMYTCCRFTVYTSVIDFD